MSRPHPTPSRLLRPARLLVGRRDERGSLVIALSVIMVLVLLSSLIFVRVIGNDQIIMARQNTFAGVSGANAGLSDALFQLDQGNTGNGSTLCLNALNSSDPNCTVHTSASTPQLTGVSYVARLVSSGPLAGQAWTVQALGNAQTGMKGAVQETLTRTALFPFALFGKKSLSFTGATQGNFGSFVPGPYSASRFTTCPAAATNPPCLYIGTNGSITCTASSQSPASVTGVYYNTGSGGGGDSCGTPQPQNTIYNVPPPTAPVPPSGVTYTCPYSGMLGSGNGHPEIEPGTYVCTSPVNVSGTLTVDGGTDANPVKLYVILSGASNTASTAFAQIATDSQINTTITYADASSGGPTGSDVLPDPQLFQLYTNSIGLLTVNGNHGFVYGGILDAPEASITTNGCKSYFFGAAIINTYTCHGGPNLGIFYDTELSQYYGPWQVSGYQQVNPAAVLANIP